MGCNMCVVQKPEEQYKIMFQTMGVADCVDSCTQTDISFQHPDPPPSPPLPPLLEPYLFSEYYDPNDYFDISQHEVDRQDELEYELQEVELCKLRQQDKLGLTVCYRTDDEEDLGIYIGEFQVNPNSIAAIDGRIRKGDRILQINGFDIQDREEAVAILTREDSTNVSLLLAPDLLQTVLSNSQELDSGLGRTDESTRYEESSEHDLLGDDHTSASNTNATNTPGSMRRFLSGAGDAPALLHSHDLRFSTDSLRGMDSVGGGGLEQLERLEKTYVADAMRTVMPGLTEEECERYKELLEIKCYYEQNDGVPLDVNRNEGLTQHELALLEEELRHLEFKCRNILRAQKMQQLRERCLKDLCHHALSDINELPDRERSDKDSTSAYNTGGESCRSTPLVSEQYPSHSTQSLDVSLCSEGVGRSAENSPYLSRRHTETNPPPRYLSCMQLRSPSTSETFGFRETPSIHSGGDWKVKIRSDGSRYVAKRPVRDRLLKARAMKIREERSGMTTDDDAVSEMKMGRYWSKEERKQQLLKAREQRRRREFMMQSRLDCLRERESLQGASGGQQGAVNQQEPPSILELCHRRSMKKRSRKILDNWITIQELLTHGARSADGKKVYNPLLSVTTV
uniref:PDZ domain containing 4 n=1 Tax=Cynoglossus semilaevis TaxID=244447 RepID=A0A3P8X0R1_CYNSE